MKKVVLIMVLAACVMSASVFAATTVHTTGKGCSGCHTPHGGNMATQVPLWNSIVTDEGGTFTLYDSGTFDGNDITQPDGSSAMCLSCHDGAIADANQTAWGGGMDIGALLDTSHPISFSYARSVSEGDTGLELEADADVTALLENGKVQCASCHDVHSDVAKALVMNNDTGQLCQTCHLK